MIRMISLLLLIPFAMGWLAGALALCAVVAWLALCDGYAAGRRIVPAPDPVEDDE